jgi:hypothetical protein
MPARPALEGGAFVCAQDDLDPVTKSDRSVLPVIASQDIAAAEAYTRSVTLIGQVK